ncbi:hypothetical protein L596_026152 [Steinernema carpocapsae]|nr:hypothetical protein L596_026152 [Steinernema carpocapsae]
MLHKLIFTILLLVTLVPLFQCFPAVDVTVDPTCSDGAGEAKCKIWMGNGFCGNGWYPIEKRRELCGKTCGQC